MIATRFSTLPVDDRPADAGLWGCNIDLPNRRFTVEFDLHMLFAVPMPDPDANPVTGANGDVWLALMSLVMTANATILRLGGAPVSPIDLQGG